MSIILKSAVATGLVMAGVAADAQSVTFAQFAAQGRNRNVQIIDSPAGVEFRQRGASQPVRFDDFGTIYNASFVLDARSTGPATVFSPNGVSQVANQLVDGTFSFIENGTGRNLLSATFSNALIVGTIGSNSLTFNGNSTSGGVVEYTSDLGFTFGSVNDFAWAITGTRSSIRVSSNGNLNSNLAFGNGNFSTTVVPEPATWGLLIAGFAMVGLQARRRKASLAA